AMAVVVVVLGIVRLVRHGSDYRRRAPGAPPRGWTAEAPGRQNARLPIVPARDPRRELPPGPVLAAGRDRGHRGRARRPPADGRREGARQAGAQPAGRPPRTR